MHHQWQYETRIEDLEEQIRRLEDLLLHTQRLAILGQLTANISHELRNQLTSMLGHIELAQQNDLAPQVVRDLQTVEVEAKRASEMVTNILSFARKGFQQIPENPININMVVQRALFLCMYRLRSQNVQIMVATAPLLPEVPANAILLQQALVNLILNAEQALTSDLRMREQPREIKLTTWCDGDAVCIRVEDNGPGIDPAIRNRIFEPFVTTRPDGTGLGLKIVQNILDVHGALLDVDSTIGQGTAMTIRLPCVPQNPL